MAMVQADNLNNVAHAAETLILESYVSYQAGLPVTRNGVTLAFGTTSGQALTPTLDNLRSMNVGITPSDNFGNYKTLNTATYITSIQRVPAGCELSPNGHDCNITGMVCMDRPVQNYGAAVGETDDFAIGKMIGKIGGDAGTSIVGSQANITGAGNSWTRPNPFAGTPIGIVCVRVGYGATSFLNFLRVSDTRDPNFQNNVTVGGNVATPYGSVGAGTGNNGADCRLGEILVSGAFWSRSATCIKRAWTDGAAGEVGVADAAGTARAVLNDAGEILSKDASGVVKAGITYTGAESNVKADNLLTNAGTAGMRPTGESFANTVTINTAAAPGGACTTNNAMVWGSGATSLVLLKCVSNVWTVTGMTIGSVGGACPTNGQLGETSTQVSLICQGGSWMVTNSRMGNFVVLEAYLANDGTSIPKPSCGSGGVAKVYEMPQSISSEVSTVANFRATDMGATWTVDIRGGANQSIAGVAIAQVGCFYN